MLSVICWKWAPRNSYRSTFKSHHVNTFARMVSRNLTIPHRIICITDDRHGIDSSIETVTLWENPVPTYGAFHRPNCFVRLKAFSKDFEKIAGDRFVSIDLDCVITGNIDPLFDHDNDFMIWGQTHDINPYNGSMWMMNTGSRSKVWDDFDPVKSPALARTKGFFGSDQSWMCYALGPNEKRWTTADGVYSYRNHIRNEKNISGVANSLPSNARLVFFHGQYNPWDAEMQKIEWVEQHYR